MDPSTFILKLSDDIRDKNLSESQLEHVYDFMVDYKKKESESKDDSSINDSSYSIMMKYLFMGWYVYSAIE